MEMRKIKSHKRVTEERDQLEDDDIMNTVLFTAGAALLMACVKRAMIKSLVEQYWRAWVFLALNLVLLAIVFTSLRSASNENQECNDDHAEMKIERNENKRHCTGPAQAEDHCGHKVHREKSDENEVDGVDDPDEDHAGEAPMRLSKEELNERVETFIAMFRQHLASDAKKGRSDQFFVKPARAEVLNFQKVSYMTTLSPRGTSCA